MLGQETEEFTVAAHELLEEHDKAADCQTLKASPVGEEGEVLL